MKKKKDTMGEWIIALIIGGLVLFFLLRSQKQEEERIINNGKFTIGEVTFYSSSKPGFIIPRGGGSTPKPSKVNFKYVVDSIEYENHEANGPGISYIPNKGIQEGERYLVIFNINNPEDSKMLFKYPIKDSGDFERYVKDLKNNPEKLRNYSE